jgi:hypothetical protein
MNEKRDRSMREVKERMSPLIEGEKVWRDKMWRRWKKKKIEMGKKMDVED